MKLMVENHINPVPILIFLFRLYLLLYNISLYINQFIPFFKVPTSFMSVTPFSLTQDNSSFFRCISYNSSV